MNLRRALLAVAAVAMAAGLWWWQSRVVVPGPPLVEAMGDMDPEVASLLRELRGLVDVAPFDANARARFGMASEANGFVRAAHESYDAAAQLDPTEPRWPYRLALMLDRLGNREAALAALARTNELAADYAPAWTRRGNWLLDRGDISGAQTAFERAAVLAGADAAARIGLARVRLERRDDARAVIILEELLQRHPGDRYALQLLGTAYQRLGRQDDARFALAVGAAGEPSWNDPWSDEVARYRRGFATQLKAATHEAMAGRFERAIPLLEELRRRKPEDVALANHLADVLLSAGRRDDARAVVMPLVERGAANVGTFLTLASVHLASDDPAAAETWVNRALALDAPGARAHEIKALIAWRAGHRAEAVRLLHEGLARDPRHVKLLGWLGLIRLEDGDARGAVDVFGEVLRREPMHAEALAGLAMAYAALGAHDEAALALKRAEQVAPQHPRVRVARARLAELDRSKIPKGQRSKVKGQK